MTFLGDNWTPKFDPSEEQKMKENDNDVGYLYKEMLFERPLTGSVVIIKCPEPMTQDECNEFWEKQQDTLPGFMLSGIR